MPRTVQSLYSEPMRFSALLLVLETLLLAVPIGAQGGQTPGSAAPKAAGTAAVPAEIRQGDALLIWMPAPAAASDYAGEAVLRSPEGTPLQRSPGVLVPGSSDPGRTLFIFGIPMDAAPGSYSVEIRGTRSGIPDSSSHPLTVLSRDFLAEDIPLNRDLTSLRTEPSPRKEEEARVYAEILGRSDPGGVWLDGSFLRPVASERRTSHFGDRRRYLYATGGTAAAVHAGIDFAAPAGTPVKAAGRGRVVLAADREVTGNTVVLEHLPGVYTIYMHLDALSAAPGAVLERGAVLGTVGSTGLATGPHLHWELRVRGVACDPETPAFSEFPRGP